MHYFFSDVHLGLGSREASRERERDVIRFLEMVGAANAESLYIVGDLFDYWFEYRSVIPREFVRTIAAIAALVDAGVRVEYLIGNHDFGHRDFFRDDLGVQVHHNDIECSVAGRRCYISHGDGKAFNDTGYLILKRVLRARLSNSLFRIFHPDIGIGAAMYASRRSRDHTTQKNYDGLVPGESDGLFAFAQQKIEQNGFQLVVMGHSHSVRRVDMPGGAYINLGSWLGPKKMYLTVDEHEVELRELGAGR